MIILILMIIIIIVILLLLQIIMIITNNVITRSVPDCGGQSALPERERQDEDTVNVPFITPGSYKGQDLRSPHGFFGV